MNLFPPPDPERALGQPTRRKLLSLLIERGSAMSTATLAVELGLHMNGVRGHLRQLVDAGLVEHTRTSGSRGRPSDLWTAAPGADAYVEPLRTYEDLSRWLAGSIGSEPVALRNVEATGRAVGHDLAVASTVDGVEGVLQTLTALGFRPSEQEHTESELTFSLNNCPYRDAVRENPGAVCALHRGLTKGLLECMAPHSTLTKFIPRDPDKAGCLIRISQVTEGLQE